MSTLPRTMQAVVCHGPEDYRLEEVPTPQAGPEEVVVKIASSGVCASDLKCYLGAPLFWGDEHRTAYVETPVIPGHEFVGEVVELGEGAAKRYGLEIGDMAIAEQILPCWQCRYCLNGHYWMCQQARVFGFKHVAQGSMAEYMKFPVGSLVHKVPKAIPAAKAALIEPLSCSIHAVQRGDIEFGDVVVIAGTGTLGLGMIAAARLKNPGMLIAIDLVDYRLNIAKQLGADLVINVQHEDPIQRVLDLTDGYGCDVFIEATGHPKAVEQGLHIIRRLGTFVEFSVMREPVTVDWTIIGDTKELNIHGAHLGPYVYPIAIDYIHRGIIDVAPMVSHQFPLAEFQSAIDTVRAAKESIKVLITP
ncbi:alcohol dehydrogenase zinc-binding domain protein [Candidatus Vecturithrix granuli]|uniref:Alcohol dehydrogenase zinc-binding domain protein n=1 Tax=Vecturithrix granuli TaxID=1499967 RepID=A0A081C1B9_VECG1|nr:alcohol dehydrogenase zinc-binding domain protein [Candidatus Vecturithrix granuli]